MRVNREYTGLRLGMRNKGKLYWAKVGVVMGAIPLVIWAYETGPDAGVCGVPNERGTCTQSGCHSGTTNDPANKGSVTVNFPNGMTYAPGVVQHLSVTIADPAATQTAWGFQLTARTASNSGTQAGTFASSDSYTALQCAQVGNVFNESAVLSLPTKQVCPANMGLQYIEHDFVGYQHTMGAGSGTYQFDWTPPATNVGNITIYVAGNAGVGGPPNANGDHIYATTFTLTPAVASNGPIISPGGVTANATGLPLIGPNAYVNIIGSNLSPVTDVWTSQIINNALPAKLDGVSVTIGGKAAYVQYVSPTQIQVLTPPDLGSGSVAVQVTNSIGASTTAVVTSQQYAPGFFQWANNQPVTTHADYTDAMKNGTYGYTYVPAKPGEYIVLWGTGFGPTTPATPVGTLVPGGTTYYTATPPSLTLGGQPMPYYATALASTFAGLYQIVAQVPASMADGDWPIIATIGGVSSPSTVLLTVQH